MDKAFGEDTIYKCFAHDFETPNLEEWYGHKLSTPHYEEGVSNCLKCGRPVSFKHLVQVDMKHLIPSICPECSPEDCNCELIGGNDVFR